MNRSNKKFIPVMLMPFQEDKTIDYSSLENLIEFYLEAGAKGLFANCLSSEMFELSKQEMLESVSFIIGKVNGRVPVVATGTFQESIEDQANFVKEIYKTGVDAVIVISSLLASEEDDDSIFENNVRKLLELTPEIPLGFYECPIPYKRVLSAKFLGELVNSKRVIYHKDTSLSMDSIMSKLQETKGVEGFGLYDAYMVHAVDSLQAGSAGLSCIQGNYFPELIVWLCDNYNSKDAYERVKIVQEFLIDKMEIMHYAYPASVKYYLNLKNFPIKVVCRRTDIEELDQETIIKLQQLKYDYEVLKSKL
ncbi:dihydrodipicolinate synthase family protein [Sphingobacterium daejeonense]|uniref:Dihydrodipicolinate synthase family protein n=1 Tax=Sphingobacterium daejeonense TaxID=371142 RepID=A0ABW3RKS1_9SPHI